VYAPLPTRHESATVAGHATVRPFSWLELEGSYRHLFLLAEASWAAFAAADSWLGAVRVPVAFEGLKLRVSPVCQLEGASGGTLPGSWWLLSFGVDATLKHLTFYWHRDNATDESVRTGGAYPGYGTHSRFGFAWNFWN
jgi:hypothetical protein